VAGRALSHPFPQLQWLAGWSPLPPLPPATVPDKALSNPSPSYSGWLEPSAALPQLVSYLLARAQFSCLISKRFLSLFLVYLPEHNLPVSNLKDSSALFPIELFPIYMYFPEHNLPVSYLKGSSASFLSILARAQSPCVLTCLIDSSATSQSSISLLLS
jgi:hypothetical protein